MIGILWAATIAFGVGLATLIIAIGKVRAGWSDATKRDNALNWLYIALAILLVALVLYLVHVSCRDGLPLSSLFCGPAVATPVVAGAVVPRGAPVVSLRPGESLTLSAM